MVEENCYLYKIQSLCTKFIYIGITKNIQSRFAEHKNYSSNTNLRNLIQLYGKDYFNFIVVTSGLRTDIEELEALAILECKSLLRFNCLNVLIGSVNTGESSQIGEAHWNSKLSSKDIVDIRHFYSQGGITQREIGEIYGVSNKVISKITTGIRWSIEGGAICKNIKANKVANRRKLSDSEVVSLRKEALDILSNGYKLKTTLFTDRYGVDRVSINCILTGKSYANLAGPRFKCINRIWCINEEA